MQGRERARRKYNGGSREVRYQSQFGQIKISKNTITEGKKTNSSKGKVIISANI